MATPHASQELIRLKEQNARLRFVALGGHDRKLNRDAGTVKCLRCGGGTGNLPLECPARLMTIRELVDVSNGELQYFNNRWWVLR